jgi:hypothetical protein
VFDCCLTSGWRSIYLERTFCLTTVFNFAGGRCFVSFGFISKMASRY